MKPLTLNRTEAAAYLRGERTFWRVMRPQPVVNTPSAFKRDMPCFCPHGQPGDVIGLREAWATFDDKAFRDKDLSLTFYLADDPRTLETDGTWHRASSMPLWAIRHKPTIAAIAVERRGDLWGWKITLTEKGKNENQPE